MKILKFRAAITGLALLALVMGSLVFSYPAQAATAIIGRFYASCSYFSVDTAVNGTTDDGGGLDKFRFFIVDGAGKKLYVEDSTRRITETRGAVVTNMSYDSDGADGAPTKNPIRLQIVDLDVNNNQTAVLYEARYDASCLPASGQANFAGEFSPPVNGKGVMAATTPLYGAPGFDPLSLVAEAGKEFITVYRSVDGQWVSIFVGGTNLPWVPASTIQVNVAALPIQPTRIDGGGVPPVIIAPTVIFAPTLIPVPTNITINTNSPYAQTRVGLRLRAAPTTASAILGRLPYRALAQVLGKNATGTWLKVSYGSLTGWVSARYVTLYNATIATLPIVQ